MIDGKFVNEIRIHPADIAEIFADKIGLKDEEQYKDLEEGLYQLLTHAKNEYNPDFWAVLYCALSELAKDLRIEGNPDWVWAQELGGSYV